MPGKLVLAAIARLPTVRFSGEVFRIVRQGLREKILSTEGNRYYPGRYHVAGESGILYTSLTAAVALREIARHAAPELLAEGLAIGKVKIRLERVLDLTDDATLGQLGLSRSALTGTGLELTQAVSLAARRSGIQGLLVPSAEGEGTNLVVFANLMGEGCLLDVRSVGTLSKGSLP